MSFCYLLTAGQGTRLKPFTDEFAKPTLPLLNIPLAYYGFYLARLGGFREFLMNKHHLPHQIDDLAKGLKPHCSKIQTIDETQELLGSGGALWNARDILHKQEFFMIANGDEVLIPADEKILNRLGRFFKEKKTLACLLTCDHPDLMKSLKPVWVTPDHTVIGFGMTPPPGGPKPVHYTGYKVFSSKILDWLPNGESNIFYEVLTSAIKQGENVFHLHMDKAEWHETGNPESFFKASQHLASHQWGEINKRRQYFGWKPLQKLKSKNGELIFEDGQWENRLGQIEGHVVFGAGVEWKNSSVLKNIIIFPHQMAKPELSPHDGMWLQELI